MARPGGRVAAGGPSPPVPGTPNPLPPLPPSRSAPMPPIADVVPGKGPRSLAPSWPAGGVRPPYWGPPSVEKVRSCVCVRWGVGWGEPRYFTHTPSTQYKGVRRMAGVRVKLPRCPLTRQLCCHYPPAATGCRPNAAIPLLPTTALTHPHTYTHTDTRARKHKVTSSPPSYSL